MEEEKYLRYQSLKEDEFESVCTRCGECCGGADDPCNNLAKDAEGNYSCKDYAGRLGPQTTKSNGSFNCVSIREHIGAGTLRSGCAYRTV